MASWRSSAKPRKEKGLRHSGRRPSMERRRIAPLGFQRALAALVNWFSVKV
jgi:hypothetical protein